MNLNALKFCLQNYNQYMNAEKKIQKEITGKYTPPEDVWSETESSDEEVLVTELDKEGFSDGFEEEIEQ